LLLVASDTPPSLLLVARDTPPSLLLDRRPLCCWTRRIGYPGANSGHHCLARV